MDDEGEAGVAVPDVDIAKIGIVNLSTTPRLVILSKVDPVLQALTGAEFTLRAINGAEIKLEGESFRSDDSGIFFAGELPLGTYLLQETVAPTNPKDTEKHFALPEHYFVFQVTENGVRALKKNDADGNYEFADTNTVVPDVSDKYGSPEH